jgi:S-methylmethionine-dependent homocysteine/selenocysteine methylase
MTAARLTDGGLETSLTFHQGLDLPAFAAFPLVGTSEGRAALQAYWTPYLATAADHSRGFVVDTPTWRANPDWGARVGYDASALRAANAAAARFARDLARGADDAVVSGVIGPRGDGYLVGTEMTVDEAQRYHAEQVVVLADAGVDQVAAITMTYIDEAVGFVRAAAAVGVPAVVSFTVETDGRLPSGSRLRDAVEQVDAATDGTATGFMINCAHPTHFEDALADGPWLGRIVGLRANASTSSHAELDAAQDLDAGDPDDLAERYRRLRPVLPGLTVLGGCCGTDDRHVRAISAACPG